MSRLFCAIAALIVSMVLVLTVSTAGLARSGDPGCEVTLKAWTFDGPAGMKGWGQQHSLSKPKAVDGYLTTRITGADPYLLSPTISIDGRAGKYMRVRMRTTSGSQLKVYWTTSAGPGWAEEQSFSVPMVGDGQVHEYDFKIDHPKWTGTVTQFRYDIEPGDGAPGDVSIDEVAIYRLGPKLGVDVQLDRKAIVLPGDRVTYTAIVRNTGGEPLTPVRASLSLPTTMRLAEGELTMESPQLAPDSTFQWAVKAVATEVGTAPALLEASCSQASAIRQAAVTVTRPSTPPASAKGFQRLPNGDTFMANGKVGLLFVQPSFGVSHMSIYRRAGDEWLQVGATSPISHLAVGAPGGSAIEETDLCPTSVEQLGDGARLTGALKDKWGDVWTYSFTFGLADDEVVTKYDLTSSTNRSVYLWTGPSIQAGEGGFGSSKKDALFPGLEWLVGDERSSSTLDLAPPLNMRWAPHPYKVTVPLMAVSDGQSLVSLMWDAQQKWDGARDLPAARFSSPNWVQGQPNHLMSLTVPSIPDYVQENGQLATKPYPLLAGQHLTLEGRIVARAGASSLDAMSDWLSVYGLPRLQEAPRSYDAEVELARFGYMNTVWVDEAGFRHCAGWDAGVAPSHALLLYLDLMALGGKDTAASEELRRRIEWTAEAAGPQGLASRAASHLGGWEFPFYYGNLAEALEPVRGEVYGLMGGQGADGSWAFNPSTPEQETLGEAGSTDSGLILTPAAQLMRWARITGDETVLQSGLRALNRAMDFRVPRAAQVWECPAHSPDILSAARGVQAYLDAYIITGEPKYLDEARYWATAGLPFVYLWGDKSLPVMQYSTIPIYGATFFTLSWLGRPVQWNGLVYAYWLFQLASYDKGMPWASVAEGITRSGMQQMMAEGPYKGTYPDSWTLDGDNPNGPYINPEDVVKNVWVLKGQNPELSTVVFRDLGDSMWTDRRVHLTSAAKLSAESRTADGFEVTMRFRSGWASYSMATGGPLPTAVTLNGSALKRVSSLEAVAAGWTYDKANGRLYIKVTHGDADQLRVTYKGGAKPSSKK